MKPHKHSELIKAWADGAVIQFFDNYNNEWKDVIDNMVYWNETIKYRIKPEPKPEPEKQWMYIYNNAQEAKTWISPIEPSYYMNVATWTYVGKIEVFK